MPASFVTLARRGPTLGFECLLYQMEVYQRRTLRRTTMSITYVEAAAWAFGSRSFTVREFAGRTGSLRAARTLSELKRRGEAERVGRATYRLLRRERRPDRRAGEWARARRLILESGLPMAWTGPDAVGVWTGWRYTVSPSAYVREFHLAIPRTSFGEWSSYLRKHRLSTDPRRRIGVKVLIEPVRRIRRTHHRGEPVMPRRDVLALIRSHRGIYAEADRLVERGS